MVKLTARARRSTGHYLALLALTTTLAACGGGSDDGGDPTDADADGTPDIDDAFVDLDGDGFDDPDFDGDGIRDSVDSDADGDSVEDFLDPFVDLDSDGFDDTSGEPEEVAFVATPVSAANPCGGEPGDDGESSNPGWNDNCWVRLDNGEGEGQFADSLYTVGIQRIVFCSGFGGSDEDSYEDFADGLFGPLTETALRQYQTSESITSDGEVGPGTWAQLQQSISLISAGDFDDTGTALDAYGFEEGRCADQPLFYQIVTETSVPGEVTEGGWRLAKNPPNTSDNVPFSIDSNLSVID